MLVSHTHRFIYVKTLKTAGTSVESYFERYCMPPGEWVPSHSRDQYESHSGIIGYRGARLGSQKPIDCKWWNHMSAAQIKSRLGDQLWSTYYKFCVVRNPFDQLVSHFYYTHPNLAVEGFRESHKDIFCQWLFSANLPRNGTMYMLNGECCMDFLVRYEQLYSDLAYVCLRLGIEWKLEELPGYKSGIRPSGALVRAVYNDDARMLVEKSYANELSFLGYSFPCSQI